MKIVKRAVYLLCSILLLTFGLKILQNLTPGKFEELLPVGDPIRLSYQVFQKEFDIQDKIYLLIMKNRGDFSQDQIAELNTQVKEKLRFVPEVFKVDTLDDRKVVAVNEKEFKTYKFSEEKRTKFPFWQSLHLGKSKAALLVTVTLKSLTDPEKNQLIEKLMGMELVNAKFATPFWVGTTVSNYFFFKEQVKLQTMLCPLILLVMAGFLIYLFRSFKVGLYFVLNIVVIYFLLAVTIGLLDGGINPYSSFALFFTLIIATSDLIHLFYSWTEGTQDLPNPHVFKRCFYTSLTTVVAFLTFIFNSNASMQDLGKYSALGGVIAFLVTFYLFPFSLKLWTGLNRLRLQKRSLPNLLPKKGATVALIILLLMTILSVVTLPKIKIDEDPYQKFSSDHYLNQGISELKKEFGFVGPLDLTLELTNPELSKEALNELYELENKLLGIPGVTNARSLASLFDETFYDDKTLQKGLDFERLKYFTKILTNFQLTDYYYHPSSQKLRVEIFVKTTSSFELTKINQKIQESLKGMTFNHLKDPTLVGFPQMILAIYKQFKTDFFYSLGGSLIFIYLCFCVLLKSSRKALLAVIPNILPLHLAGGIVGFLSWYFGYALESNLLVISCVVLGIAVDDTIHFLLEVEQQKTGHDLETALKRAELEVGDALKATTYVLITAFISFFLSDIVLFAQMGVMIAFSLWLALLADLWLMPYLILRFKRLWE